MRRVILNALIAGSGLMLSSCASAPPKQGVWVKASNPATAGDERQQQQTALDRLACIGEAEKAGLASSQITIGSGSTAGLGDQFQQMAMERQQSQNRRASMIAVMRGCMAQRGYILRDPTAPE